MFEVDEDSDQQQRNENPVGDCDWPRELEPDSEKEKSRHQFHHEIAERDRRSRNSRSARAERASSAAEYCDTTSVVACRPDKTSAAACCTERSSGIR